MPFLIRIKRMLLVLMVTGGMALFSLRADAESRQSWGDWNQENEKYSIKTLTSDLKQNKKKMEPFNFLGQNTPLEHLRDQERNEMIQKSVERKINP